MANQEHLKYFMRGMTAWNKWRNAHPDVKPDLRDTILSEKELREKFRGICDLSGADLSGADLSGVNLKGAYLMEANLSKANLRGTDLSDFGSINLQRSNLSSINLSGANLSHANLSNQHLSGSNLNALDLSGADLSNTNLERANLSKAILTDADLSKSKLAGANLNEANLSGAILCKADLSGANLLKTSLSKANLEGANISRATLRGANLSNAILIEAYLYRATLSNADLTEANLRLANLIDANLIGADLSRADLSFSTFVRTNLKGTTLTECRIYGISAWDVELTGAKQNSLVITPPDEPIITVDNLKIAQFIYLLLNNKEIREVIDTITSKVVLILGRFTPERKVLLDALREELRKRSYLPVLFDFEKPSNRDLTETVSTLAHLARFVIADLTDAKSIPQELDRIVPNLPSVAVQPLILNSQHEYGMFEHFTRYSWVLPLYRYTDEVSLLQSLQEKVIAPAEQKVKELAQQ